MTIDEPLRPDSPVLADAASSLAAAYVHVPFCARLCPYCDFNVVAGRDDLIERYISAVISEIEMEPAWKRLDAVYVGGGTPSRVPPVLLAGIVDALDRRFGIVPGAEISLEANPEDWTPVVEAGLREAGFTRVSFGVQSFDGEVLKTLGRTHTPEQAEVAVSTARLAGFSVNVDLIFGTPGESEADWVSGVARALSLIPDHLSAYGLTVERGTALSRAVAAGAPAPDADLQADEYEALEEAAAAAGLVRYEVSNYARPGHTCVYNLVTWAQGDYLAFGAGAHGHRNGERARNVHRIDAYLNRVEAGIRPVQSVERLDSWGREQERLFLGLRRTAGVEAGHGGVRLLESVWGTRLQHAGVIERQGSRIRVRRPLLTDEVSRAVLALAGCDC
ncbi:MAG: radical SAM family heme chaperone HemW [Gammaproteobacteria bacterium]|nr:radical SAM family heme chaperone HemW [Gammaproteobacteria bacterium]